MNRISRAVGARCLSTHSNNKGINMKRLNRTSSVLGAIIALAATSAHAELVSADGGLAVYDSANNLTWTSNANLFASQYGSLATIIADANGANGGAGLLTGIVKASDFNSSGTMTWAGANAWVYYLDVTAYGGSTNWKLPTTVDSSASLGYANGLGTNPSPTTSQLAQLVGDAHAAELGAAHAAEVRRLRWRDEEVCKVGWGLDDQR